MNLNPTLLLQIVLTVVNVITLAVFGVDKLQSKRNGGRVRESRLLSVAFFGPFGAFVAMILFRHKTRKTKFLLVPAFLILQLVLIVRFLGWSFFLPP